MLRPTYLIVRDGVTFLCGIPGIQRMGKFLWWVPMTGSIYLMMVAPSYPCVLLKTPPSLHTPHPPLYTLLLRQFYNPRRFHSEH
ncbi:unnamed protein product, partial [Staurois parvus]